MNNFLLLSLYFFLLSNILRLLTPTNANEQVTNLFNLLNSNKPVNPSLAASWATLPAQIKETRVYIGPQEGLREADMITSLPGQPDDVDFDHYAGYVSVDPAHAKALFYYFVESPNYPSLRPLVLWLNGGPGCSSVGNGALRELGPFRVKSDGKSLILNPYSWHNVANMLFLDSPAGVGFSYGNESFIFGNQTGDISTARDAYTFLVNWFERFPEYKNRDFYIMGESYAGHFAPQLAYTILHHNQATNNSINLKGIAIGNAWLDDTDNSVGFYDNLWNQALISDKAHANVFRHCNFSDFIATIQNKDCRRYIVEASKEIGDIDIFNIYAPSCPMTFEISSSSDSIDDYNLCSSSYVEHYLGDKKVQQAFHAKPTLWSPCRLFLTWQDRPSTVLPIIQQLITSNLRVWLFSGDVDGYVPPISTRYSLKSLKLHERTPWRPWSCNDEVGGRVIEYKGLTFVTIRGAGHEVANSQPQRALKLFSSFIQGTFPPSSKS